jgi:hypothetical protein
MCIIDVESEIWMRSCFVCVDWRMHGRLAAIKLSCPVADEKVRNDEGIVTEHERCAGQDAIQILV